MNNTPLRGSTDRTLLSVAPPTATILLVDDSPARLLSYEVLLAGMGLVFERALSGTEALERLLTDDVAAVLLDVSMPGMDGFEVARTIRAHPRFERTPIIFVTGVHLSELDRLHGYEVGAIDYIAVPVVPEILRAKVAVLVELYQRRRELQQLNRALEETRAELAGQHARAAAESEAQLRAVLEHPTELTVVLQPQRDDSRAITDWIYRNANTNAMNLLGVTREALIGRRLSDVLPERSARLTTLCAQVLTTREMIRYEETFRGRDFVVTLFAMGSNAVVSASLDVTERKQMIAQLRDSEERFRKMVALLPVGVCTIKAPSGEITYYNDQAAQLWGRRPEPGDTEERFCGSFRLWTPDGAPLRHDQTPMTQVLSEGRPLRNLHVVIERPPPASSRITVLVNIDPILDAAGRIVGAVNVFHDVTAQYEAEQTVREAEGRLKRQQQELRTVLDVVPLAVLVARDPSGDDIVGSPSFAALTGVPAEENISQSGPNRDRLPYHYEQQGRVLDAAELPLQQAARLRRVVRDMEMDMVFDDGRVVHLLSQATPLLDEQGNVRGAVGTNVDITALTRAHRALEAADRQKNDFIATLAHELRNPLAPIRYAAGLLKRDTSAPSIEHAIRVIDRQAGHMALLLDDLLDLSRITRNAVELKRTAIDLRPVLDAAIENARPMLQENHQHLERVIETAPLWVHGDPVRLLQIVDNLLSNACKYTGAGGRIAVRARREGDRCVIEVSDSGIGISAEQIADVFTMFGQADPAMQATKAGLGIGLAISRRLVEMHGGTITVRSEGAGKGSTFMVTLPYRAPAGEPTPASDDPDETDSDLARLQVLVVDDNIDAAETLKTLLTLAGLQAEVAHTAAVALATAEAMRPDVLLLDVGLPDASGLEVARQIRSTAWGRSVLLVALTGWGGAENRAQTAAAGFDTHLVKPVDGEQILALLAKFRRSR